MMKHFAREHIQNALAGSPSPVFKKQLLPAWLAALLRIPVLLRGLRNHISFIPNHREELQ
jgi:hypothetical protein